MENSNNNQIIYGNLKPFSTFSSSQVLWSSEKTTKEKQSIGDGSSNETDNTTNLHVILRCRPMNEEEETINVPVAVSCDEYTREVSVVQKMLHHEQINQSFIFDGVFGPKTLQKDLFEQVIVPIIDKALEGYICTILAYGQSGTGKTYTMEGYGNIHTSGADFDDHVGVIPRAVIHIFNILETRKVEYTLKVTYLELYNEEITDLLVDKNLIENQNVSIKIMEDGKGNVFLRGLKEIEVKNIDDVYKILDLGAIKKHTATTFFNEKSNRSHSIFSISIHTKDLLQDGVVLVKCGKINFVDLAGSENIELSGAREERARGAGMINKSLLTLGRVINVLVEHSNHVPYRDSKLTRLLRDSLGGRTKTCLIATISPSISCLEETINTLEYAYRAKNIKNRPEVNQKVLRSALLLDDLDTEFHHLKTELHVTREENGIYIPQDEYLKEQAAKKKVNEIQEVFVNQQEFGSDLNERHKKTQRDLEGTSKDLAELKEKYRQANQTIREKDYLIYNLLGSEKGLTETAFQLQSELENAASEVSSLLEDIGSKSKKEGTKKVAIQNFHAHLVKQLKALHMIVADLVKKQEEQLKAIEEDAQLIFSEKSKATDQLKARVEELKVVYNSGLKKSEDLAEEISKNLSLSLDNLETEMPKHSKSIMDSFRNFASEVDVVVDDLQNNLVDQKEKVALFVKQQQEAYSRTLCATQTISITVFDFFVGLSTRISNIELLVEESHNTDEELCTIEKKLEEFAANEEKQLLVKFSEMLASSNAKRKIVEKQIVDGLRESVAQKHKKFDQEMMKMKKMTTSLEKKWTNYFQNMVTRYIEDSIIAHLTQNKLEECHKHCEDDAEKLSKQWRNAEQHLLCLEKTNADFNDSIIKKGLQANQTARAQASSISSVTFDAINTTRDCLLSSLAYIERLGEDASEKFNFATASYRENMRQMEINHSYETDEIIQNSENFLINDKVDEHSYVETKKPSLDLPSVEAIEELKTPPLDELLKSFRANKVTEKLHSA